MVKQDLNHTFNDAVRRRKGPIILFAAKACAFFNQKIILAGEPSFHLRFRQHPIMSNTPLITSKHKVCQMSYL
ncbi:hypothetical protein CS022_08595 [Veronia nyctiphanis]|uniref:Uncharacterized protein n=1 Tax=Veronia nyctiphanis TaxID=1278244 RepID=A0A4Q0YR41_9GAMM|nr:hypothetical protein CS022_08595 [Veronia nyctiphanis]